MFFQVIVTNKLVFMHCFFTLFVGFRAYLFPIEPGAPIGKLVMIVSMVFPKGSMPGTVSVAVPLWQPFSRFCTPGKDKGLHLSAFRTVQHWFQVVFVGLLSYQCRAFLPG